MPRRRREATGRYVYHALNRAVGRSMVFETPTLYYSAPMWDLIKSFLSVIVVVSFCACVVVAFLLGTAVVYMLSALRLGAVA
jgi:hypothetical protein